MPRKPQLDLSVRRRRVFDEAAAEALERRAEVLGTRGAETKDALEVSGAETKDALEVPGEPSGTALHAPQPPSDLPVALPPGAAASEPSSADVDAQPVRDDLPARYERDRNVLKRRGGVEVRRMCIYLPLPIHDRLTRLCFESGRTQTDVINEALGLFLERSR